MAYDINKLKAISKSTVEVINTKINSTQKFSEDTRFWKVDRDEKTQTGSAVIRFLPSLSQENLPWVQVYDYFIHAPNGWYVENSLKTIGQPDPMNEYIRSLWSNAKTDEEKNGLRGKYKERMQYISNILVVNDPKHPENNGKVFLFKFGKKIFDKIVSKTRPDPAFPDEAPCNIFDWDEGANFKLRVKMVDKFPNYDSSEFMNSSKLSESEIVNIAENMFDLGEFVDPSKFKSYDELKAKVNRVFGIQKQEVLMEDEPTETFESPAVERKEVEVKEPTPWDDDDLNFDSLKDELDNI